MSGKRLLIALAVVLALGVIPGVLVPTLLCRRPDPKLDDLGPVGTFALVDERGQAFTEDALRGHITIANFVFTRCDTICPITSAKMQRIQDKTFDVGAAIKLVSFSVDPAYDTPARLTAYAQRFGADPTRWRFVTGDPAKMHALVEGPMMMSMQNQGVTVTGAPAIAHNGHFLLIDKIGEIRGAYDSGDLPRLDEMIHDARFLARTQQAP
jgi:protein SCO1/2